MAKANDDVVEIVDTPPEMGKYVDAVRDNGAGAISTFIGTTRDTFQGREVLELRYEAYKPMAVLELKKICIAARSRWSLIGVAVAHRLGIVPIGEESVFIAVSSAHRKDALEACQFLIDELKATVPIWKKEVYSSGEAWKENREFLERCQNRPCYRIEIAKLFYHLSASFRRPCAREHQFLLFTEAACSL